MPCIRLERAENGYTVCATDPKIQADNDKPGPTNWRDPEREYVFTTLKAALGFIEKIADKALPVEDSPPDPFASAFKDAAADKK